MYHPISRMNLATVITTFLASFDRNKKGKDEQLGRETDQGTQTKLLT